MTRRNGYLTAAVVCWLVAAGALALLFSGCAGFKNWAPGDKTLWVSYNVLSAADAVQTLSCGDCSEINPMLAGGDGRPDALKVIGGKALVSGLSYYLLSTEFVEPYRTQVLVGMNVIQGAAVAWNIQFMKRW